ncbi:MAG: hypothetical protein GX250_00775 [Clostridiales bacterium]|jgi:hypothetical protein|nr:hypothetical protein [Clostridiales bacterium]
MLLFLIFVLIIATLIYLIFTRPVELSFWLSSGEKDMELHVSWLGVLRACVKRVNFRTHVAAYVFKARIYSGFLKKTGKGFNSEIIRALSLSDTELKTCYGLNGPHITGILFGVLSAIASMVGLERFEQYPEFLSGEEYLQIEGSSKLNIGRTVSNYVRLKLKKRKRRKYHGSLSVKH